MTFPIESIAEIDIKSDGREGGFIIRMSAWDEDLQDIVEMNYHSNGSVVESAIKQLADVVNTHGRRDS